MNSKGGQHILPVPLAFLTISFIISTRRENFPDKTSMPHRDDFVK